MTLNDFMNTYYGDDYISIKGLFDHLYKEDVFNDVIPYDEFKDKNVISWYIRGGEFNLPVEIYIELDD